MWRAPYEATRLQLWPPRALIFLPEALDLHPNAKTALPTRNGRARRPGNESERLNCFPDAQDSFPRARVSRMAARELSRASGKVSAPPGFLDGRPDRDPGSRVRWMAVRERSNSIREHKNETGSSRIKKSRLEGLRRLNPPVPGPGERCQPFLPSPLSPGLVS